MATRPIPAPTATRTISTAEANAHLDTVVDSVSAGEGDVILERDGTPKAAVVSMEDYRAVLALREQERKAAAARVLREYQATYDGRNDDLSEDEIMELAVRATKEIRAERWMEQKSRKSDALKRFQALMAQQAAINADLSEEEAMELAVRATKETRGELWEAMQQLCDDQQRGSRSHHL